MQPKKKKKEPAETIRADEGSTEGLEEENPTDIGPGITERYEDA